MHELEKNFLYIFAFIPVSPGVILPWVVTMFCLPACLFLSRKLDKEAPEKYQNFLEYLYETFESLVANIVGTQNVRELLPILSTIFIYIFFANLMGIIPGLKAPMGLFTNALGMALIVFCLMFWLGFKHHGIGYFKHFTGPVWWLAPLMIPINIVGELSRPLSLTFRLFGNIMGEDIVILVLTGFIFPLIVPVPMHIMAIFTSLLQALVFTILSGIYFSEAVSDGN